METLVKTSSLGSWPSFAFGGPLHNHHFTCNHGSSTKAAARRPSNSRFCMPLLWENNQPLRITANVEDTPLGQGSSRPAVERPRQWPLPETPDQQVDQARGACRRAIGEGKMRLRVDLLLPLIGATQLDDWPGGVRQQFRAAEPMVLSLLNGLVDGKENMSAGGSISRVVIDPDDAVVVWESSKVAVMVFPTAETLSKAEELAKNDSRPLLLVNPQWQPGQAVSDFGFGSRKKAAEDFVETFENAYALRQLRVRSEDVRVLRCYPTGWQVLVGDATGGSECISVEAKRPDYRRIEELLKARGGSDQGSGWFGRLVKELKFNQDTLK